MTLPLSIQAHIEGKTGHTDSVGMSGSSVTVFEDCVLKIEAVTPCTEQTVAAMDWLARRIPSPKVLAHEIRDGRSFLLMSRIPGEMSCDPACLARPEMLVSLLADAMTLLWKVDAAGCPRDRRLPALLKEARWRVENGLVDLDNVEPETFGPGGFESPEALLRWLEENPVASCPVLTHGDFCLPNVFQLEGKFSGFVDVGDAGLGEKWRDIALCWRSLRSNMHGAYGGRAYPDFDPDVLFDALGIKPDRAQLRWHLLLDELF